LHFLTGDELTAGDLTAVLDRALALKQAPRSSDVFTGKTVALLFEQPSTRTRTSMEAGVVELGGHPMVLRANELQLTRGESIRDTALVFSRHVAAIGLRTGDDALLDRAGEGVVALHCLPAHPGEEITESVLYGDRQRIWDQAENRRHAQKALLEFLVSSRSAEG
jgi:ornithine carbamoyltransferase